MPTCLRQKGYLKSLPGLKKCANFGPKEGKSDADWPTDHINFAIRMNPASWR